MLVVHARSSSPARPVTGAQRGWEVAKRRISDDADGLRRLLDLLTEAGATAEAPIPVAVIFGLVVVACTSKVLLYPVDCDFSNPSFPW